MHGAEVKAVDCPAIDGIIEEADETAGEVADKAVLDAALINAAQAAEHYEIVRYGSLIAWAKQLGRSDCAAVLAKTLEEEKATDKKLTIACREQGEPARRELTPAWPQERRAAIRAALAMSCIHHSVIVEA